MSTMFSVYLDVFDFNIDKSMNIENLKSNGKYYRMVIAQIQMRLMNQCLGMGLKFESKKRVIVGQL